MGKKIFSVCILAVLLIGIQGAAAATLSIQPSQLTIETSGRSDLSVSGASGYVTWQAMKGAIQGTGTLVSYIAPAEAGSDVVMATDSAGNMATVAITVTPAGQTSVTFVRENAMWKTYINRDKIRSLAYSDDGKFLWAATNGGIEKRDAQTGEIFKVYGRADGLPSLSVNAILSDFNSGLWAGTDKGLVRIKSDGTIQVFTSTISALPNDTVNALLSDDKGGIYIGTSGGLVRLKLDNTWETISGAPSGVIYALSSDGKSGLWLGTNMGLTHLKSDGKWETPSAGSAGLPFNNVYAVRLGVKGDLWAGSNNQLAHLKTDGTWEYFDSNNSGFPVGTVLSLQSDINGIYAGTDGGGLARIDSDGIVETWTVENSNLPDNHISALLIAGSDGVWVGTHKGLARLYADASSKAMNQENPGIPSNKIYSSASDGSGGLWIGTDQGLARYDILGNWTTYTQENSKLPQNTVYALASDDNKGIWIGTGAGLAHLKADNSWEIFTQSNSKLPSSTVYALVSDGRKGVWIGTGSLFLFGGGGLAHLKSDGSWEIFGQTSSNPFGSTNSSTSVLPNSSVRSLFYDSNRGLWVGTEGGLAYRKSSGTWEIFDKASGLPDNLIRSLYEDGLGGMWVGTESGLAHRTQDGLWESYTQDNSGLPNNSVKALIPDSYNGLWVGTADRLGYFYQNDQWDMFDNKNSGLPDMVINSFTPDNEGGLWIGTDEGLTHLRFSEKPVLKANLQDETVKTALVSERRAAIIVQPRGGDDDEQNLIFRQIASYAYQTLVARGYDNNEIYFLSHRPDADVTGDFVADTYAVDAPVTMTEFANGTKAKDIKVDDIRTAFDWAVGKGKLDQPLLFIFVGLGTDDALKLSPFGDTFKGSELNTMIGNYQKAMSGKVIALLETPSAAKVFGKIFGQNRILIGSTNSGKANYDAMGMISFNSLLFNSLRSGKNFYEAFQAASQMMTSLKTPYSSQNPQIDDTGDGQSTSGDGNIAKTFCLNGCFEYPLGKITLEPVSKSSSVNMGQTVDLSVTVQTEGSVGVQRLWGIISSPENAYKRDAQGFPTSSSTVLDMSQKAQYKEFKYRGDYVAVFMAKDKNGNVTVSQPVVYNLPIGKDIALDPIPSQSVYYDGNQCKITIPPESPGKARYVRMAVPGLSNLLMFTALNTPVTFDGSSFPAWKGAETVVDLKVTKNFPRGDYRVELIYVPTGVDPLKHLEQWEIGEATFKIAATPVEIAAPIPSQTKYVNGDQCRVTLPALPSGKKQYAGLMIPNNTTLFIFKGLNDVSAFDGNALSEWKSGTVLLDLPVTASIPRGEYTLYLLRVPDTVSNPLTNTGAWELGEVKFKVE